jgi:hypothetical protein
MPKTFAAKTFLPLADCQMSINVLRLYSLDQLLSVIYSNLLHINFVMCHLPFHVTQSCMLLFLIKTVYYKSNLHCPMSCYITLSIAVHVNIMGPAGFQVRSWTPIQRILSSFCMRMFLLPGCFTSMKNKTFGMQKYQPSPPIIQRCQEGVCPLCQPSPS